MLITRHDATAMMGRCAGDGVRDGMSGRVPVASRAVHVRHGDGGVAARGRA